MAWSWRNLFGNLIVDVEQIEASRDSWKRLAGDTVEANAEVLDSLRLAVKMRERAESRCQRWAGTLHDLYGKVRRLERENARLKNRLNEQRHHWAAMREKVAKLQKERDEYAKLLHSLASTSYSQ